MYIQTTTQLLDLCAQASRLGVVGVDLEFIPENTYYPVLALIQLAVGDRLVLVDPLGELDLTPVDEMILDPGICKVVHAGTQDMGIFFHRIGRPPQNVFDTQLAAAFAGLGHQISYGGLVSNLFGVTLKKGYSYTNWLKRPLSQSQEDYAIDDVRYLIGARQILVDRLESLGRLEWVREELGFYEDSGFYRSEPDDAHMRVKKGTSLKGRDHLTLRHLAAWREFAASSLDQPRRKIMEDALMLEIARRRPASRRQLGDIRGISPMLLKRHGDAIARTVQQAMECPVEPRSEVKGHVRLSDDEEMLVEFLLFCLRAVGVGTGVAPSYLGSRRDLERLVHSRINGTLATEPHPLLMGWRKEAVGDKLLQCLSGDLGVRFHPDSGKLVFEQMASYKV